MAFENDGIVVEFSFGGITLTPSEGPENLLTVTKNGVSTFVGAGHFAKIIEAGLFSVVDDTADGVLELTQKMEAAPEPKSACSMGRFELIHYKDGSLGIHIAPDYGIESNFEFYLDGWTLKGNSGAPSDNGVGSGDTFEAVSPNAEKITVKSSALTAFLERRLTPGESDASITV
jgi:hypothetical protein